MGKGSFPKSLTEVFGLSQPYDQLYFIPNWARWAKEAEIEYQNCSVERRGYVSCCHIVELFASLLSTGSEYYVQVSVNWQEEFECHRLLRGQTPSDFANYSDVVLQNDVGAWAT